MDRFAKIVKPFTIFAKCSILDVWQGSKYACEFKFALWHLELFHIFSDRKTEIQFEKCFR